MNNPALTRVYVLKHDELNVLKVFNVKVPNAEKSTRKTPADSKQSLVY